MDDSWPGQFSLWRRSDNQPRDHRACARFNSGSHHFFGSVSLGGFIVGWRAANALGEGFPLLAFLAADEVWQLVSTVFQRPYRLPLFLWLMCAWSAFAVSGVRCWLNSGVAIAEVPGTYRATSPFPEPHVLAIKADGSWEYRRESQSADTQAGKWAFEPIDSDSATVVITFQVKSGSQGKAGSLLARDPLANRGFVFSYISRDCAGKLLVCFGADDQICFERMSEPKPRS
jgi:hypothetical protein